jgi:hypothetical protein
MYESFKDLKKYSFQLILYNDMIYFDVFHSIYMLYNVELDFVAL